VNILLQVDSSRLAMDIKRLATTFRGKITDVAGHPELVKLPERRGLDIG
jgi:hypothetical protein